MESDRMALCRTLSVVLLALASLPFYDQTLLAKGADQDRPPATLPFWYTPGTQKVWDDPNQQRHDAAYAQQRRPTYDPHTVDPAYTANKDWIIQKRECPDLKSYLFKYESTFDTRQGYHTDGAVIVKNGRIVFEEYSAARGFGPMQRHLSWSMAKSVTNALLGFSKNSDVLGDDLDLNASVESYYPEVKHGGDKQPSILQYLDMSPSNKWEESYESSPITSNATNMLYIDPVRDMASYVLSQPAKLKPGSFWEYSSGNPDVLMGVLKKAFQKKWGAVAGMNRYLSLPFQFFKRIGIENTASNMHRIAFEPDGSGTFVGSSYLYLSARDYARFGFLFLNDGKWGDDQVLPPGWVAMSRRLAPAFLSPDTAIQVDRRYANWSAITDTGVGAAHWWLNLSIKRADGDFGQPYPSAPEDTYAALGHWGQFIFVIPSQDMVIVRLGEDRDYTPAKRFDADRFLKLTLACYGNQTSH